MDDDAAGHGWSQPWHVGATARGIDLFTVITHELGHVLGLADLDADLHLEVADSLGAAVDRTKLSTLAEVERLADELLDRIFADLRDEDLNPRQA